MHCLFIGDSITDAARNRAEPEDLGHGYVRNLQDRYRTKHDIRFTNRGIAGDRLDTLLNRLDADCVSLQPDVITVMIGINNIIHRFKRNSITSNEQFTKEFLQLIRRLKDATGTRIIVMEPFLLPVLNGDLSIPHLPHISAWSEWRAELNSKLDVIRLLCCVERIQLVPLDGMFAAAATQTRPGHWAPDGVHPSEAGHEFIAQAWTAYVGDIVSP